MLLFDKMTSARHASNAFEVFSVACTLGNADGKAEGNWSCRFMSGLHVYWQCSCWFVPARSVLKMA